jgi:hypothetical protein
MSAVSLTCSMLRCEILKPGLPLTGVQISVLARSNGTLPGMNIRSESTRCQVPGWLNSVIPRWTVSAVAGVASSWRSLVKNVGSRTSDVRHEDGILGMPLGLRYVPKLLLFRL